MLLVAEVIKVVCPAGIHHKVGLGLRRCILGLGMLLLVVPPPRSSLRSNGHPVPVSKLEQDGLSSKVGMHTGFVLPSWEQSSVRAVLSRSKWERRNLGSLVRWLPNR